MPEIFCQEWMPEWLCVFIVVSVFVIPQILNALGLGKLKPIKSVADKIKPNPENSEQPIAQLKSIGIRVNTTYRDLKALSERMNRLQSDVEDIKKDIEKILEFIED